MDDGRHAGLAVQPLASSPYSNCARAFLLSLPRGHLVTSLLKFGTTYPLISGFALPYQPSNVTSKRTYLSSILHFTPAILVT